MQNIDPVVLIEPIIFIALGSGLVVYWRVKRRLAGIVLLFSLVAYAGAIAMKEALQSYTAQSVIAAFGSASWQAGVYYGLQTSCFEVGLAYLVARFALNRRSMVVSDAEGYGVSLAFWENAILLGGVSLLNLAATYLLISQGLLPQSVYQTLLESEPGLFLAPQQLALPIALAILERFSSFLLHLAWGYLCVMAVSFRKPLYAVIAVPMGMVDALVPFAGSVPAWEFEGVVFALSLAAVAIARFVTRGDRATLGSGPSSVNV